MLSGVLSDLNVPPKHSLKQTSLKSHSFLQKLTCGRLYSLNFFLDGSAPNAVSSPLYCGFGGNTPSKWSFRKSVVRTKDVTKSLKLSTSCGYTSTSNVLTVGGSALRLSFQPDLCLSVTIYLNLLVFRACE